MGNYHYDDRCPHRAGADSGLGEMAGHFAEMNGQGTKKEPVGTVWRFAKYVGTPPWWAWILLILIGIMVIDHWFRF